MANLQLSMIVSNNDRTRPVIDDLVKPDGIDLAISVAHPSEMFWRQLHFSEFDVSEMSISSFLIITAQGDDRWVMLPIFTSRQFFHTGILVRSDAGINQPADLKGKRVGVPEYQQTAALWGRAVLQHEFGVTAQDMDWYMERTEERSHGGATGFQPPAGVRFQHIPAEKTLATMLLAGEIDASLLYIADRNLVDRSGVELEGNPKVRTLFPDPVAEGARYYKKTGIFPINHGMVVRRSLLKQHPWIGINIFKAFAAAKDMVEARTRELADPYIRLGLLPQDARSALNADPFPYGVKSNRKLLETLAENSHEQGLTPRVVKLDEVFAPATMDL